MTNGRTVAWSQPVEIAFDGTKPRLSHLATSPSDFQAVGQPIQIIVRASDGHLSGVAEVIGGFTLDEEVLSDATPKTSLKKTPDGLWVGDLDTTGLTPDNHIVGIQAVDRAGNVSSLTTAQIQLVTPEDALKMAAEITNSIRGSVMYGKTPAAKATITLTKVTPETTPNPAKEPTANAEAPISVETDADGNFKIDDVLVGKYLLKAQSLIRGLNRVKEFDVEVVPPPTGIRQDIDLR